MNGIVIGIDPVAFSLGPVALTWHGIFASLAIVVGFVMTLAEARRRNLDEDRIYNLGLWSVLAALIGARLFHVVDHWAYYAANPVAILAFTSGGLSIYGGLVGGFIVGLVYALRARLPIKRVLDAVAPSLILAQAVGRIGCLINGDAHGAPADLPWAVAYTHPGAYAPQPGVPGHPYPAYEIILNLAVFALLWRLRDRVATPGVLFLIYAIAYALIRFFLSFVREETVVLWGLQQAQVIGLAGLLIAVPALVYLLRPRRKAVADTERGI